MFSCWPTLQSALTSGRIEILDLTAPLSPTTPVLQLPPPFANTIPLSLETVSGFDDDGPMWKWHNIHTGEHTGTHVDAPAHWVTGKDGWTVDQVPPERLVGPAVVVDVTAEVAADPDFLLRAGATCWPGRTRTDGSRTTRGCCCAPAGRPAAVTRRRS